MKLHVYEHCPFCVKARMIFGLKKQDFDLSILLNDDDMTPASLVGRKVAPILETEAMSMAESMDIVRYVDTLDGKPFLTGATNPALALWADGVGDAVYRLAMPRWAQAPFAEFATLAARAHFKEKKEAALGNFGDLIAMTSALISQVESSFDALTVHIQSPNAINGSLSTDDIHVFAMLRSLSIVRGLRYPEAVNAYRQELSRLSRVDLHDDIALS